MDDELPAGRGAPSPLVPRPSPLASPAPLTRRPLVRDPAVSFTALVLWLLVGLFVVYPLAMLLARVAFDSAPNTYALVLPASSPALVRICARYGSIWR